MTVFAVVPGWSGTERLAQVEPDARITATRIPLDPDHPSRTRVGALRFVGAVRLASDDPAFGGYSALAVADGTLVLLSDGGGVARLALDRAGRVRRRRFADLPAGPGSGWAKGDRDSESLAMAVGHAWVGFEHANAIWRSDAAFARVERVVKPRAMRGWPGNSGPESLARLADGRFVAIAEGATHGAGRAALAWPGDPTASRPVRWRYRPPAGFDPSDACPLPDGRLLVVNRWWRLGVPLRFTTVLTVLDPRAIRPGAAPAGREIARLGAPLLHGNIEGCAAARQGGHTVLWLVTDNDQMAVVPTLLMKFRLD